jgi:hypothetical protein
MLRLNIGDVINHSGWGCDYEVIEANGDVDINGWPKYRVRNLDYGNELWWIPPPGFIPNKIISKGKDKTKIEKKIALMYARFERRTK